MATEEQFHEWKIQNDGLRGDGNIRHAMLLEKSRKLPAYTAVFEAIAERAYDQAGGQRVRAIDELSFPVHIKHRQPAAAAGHADHLGESTLGIRDMHQHPLGATGIEGCVREAKRLGIADLEICGQFERLGTAARFAYHGFACVDADGAPFAPHQTGDFKCIVARPASDIEDLLAVGQLQSGEYDWLGGGEARQFVSLVLKSLEKMRLAGGVGA